MDLASRVDLGESKKEDFFWRNSRILLSVRGQLRIR